MSSCKKFRFEVYQATLLVFVLSKNENDPDEIIRIWDKCTAGLSREEKEHVMEALSRVSEGHATSVAMAFTQIAAKTNLPKE